MMPDWIDAVKLTWFGMGAVVGWDAALLFMLWRVSPHRRREARR